MHYTCTIYTHDWTFGGGLGFQGAEPLFDSPLALIVVAGATVRQAAARAYVKCVGRDRAERMRQSMQAPREVIAQETSCKAIAASLRKTARRIGECYELDHFVESWFIKVEPAPINPRSLRPSRRLRHSLLLLKHLSRTPLPN